MIQKWAARLLWPALTGVILFNAWNVVTVHSLYLRIIDMLIVIGLVAFNAYRIGEHRTAMAFIDSAANAIAHAPKEIAWHEDDDGVRHAMVTMMNGDLHTIAMPPEIEGQQEALRYIFDRLNQEDDD
jgi:hypothetical protein